MEDKILKGLGTSTAKEFKEYFAQKKVVWFNYNEKKVIMQLIKYLTKHVQTIEKIGWEIMINMPHFVQMMTKFIMKILLIVK